MSFKIEKRIKGSLGRSGVWMTGHGAINTPAFIGVGTQASVKSMSPEQVKSCGIQAVLANTYHLYLKPGNKIVKKAGGIHKFMNWQGPTMTDSGGFQVFSLGAAYENKLGKIVRGDLGKAQSSPKSNLGRGSFEVLGRVEEKIKKVSLVKIDEDGVDFCSVVDGSQHRFTPEKSVEIQMDIGADIIFAFDECPSPLAPASYQKEAMDRTLRWGLRSLEFHKKTMRKLVNKKFGSSSFSQQIMGVVQGGRIMELRKKSAEVSAKMEFDGFGIGGSFDKDDVGKAVHWVNEKLPEEKPRHLLGIGDPKDLFLAIENGCDTFDCVAPTRMARNGALYTKKGRMNILNSVFRKDLSKIDETCGCYTCQNFSRAYVAHLFHAKEMFAATLASIHNLSYISHLVEGARLAILDGKFENFKNNFFLG